MSKIRQQPLPPGDVEFETPPAADLRTYVVFTQIRDGLPHKLAGYLDAPDDEMAILLGKEHYGQDQECVNLWAIPRDVVAGTEQDYPASDEAGPERTWIIFIQGEAGEQYQTSGTVEATSSADALAQAMTQIAGSDEMQNVWVVAQRDILSTPPGDLIWRHVDQSYRLARGYSKDVREKWERLRAERDLREYEKDDIKEMF